MTFRMRTLTITSSDDPWMRRMSSSSLLPRNPSQTVLERVLNAAVDVVIGEIPVPFLGTVLTLGGFGVRLRQPTIRDANLTLYGTSSWNLVFTQVWSDWEQIWFPGSSVEWLDTFTSVGGHIWCNFNNHAVSSSRRDIRSRRDSPRHNDATWRRNSAAQGFWHGIRITDTVNRAVFRHDGVTHITHNRAGW